MSSIRSLGVRALIASTTVWVALACGSVRSPESAPAAPEAPAPRGKAPRGQDTPPNWLVILVDDFGTDKVGAYGEHPSPPATPSIDRLAQQGLLFRNAYANPVCSPSRAALLTGRYGRRTGFGAIVEIAESRRELPLDEVLIPEVLDQGRHDWTSVVVGKWHLSTYKSPSGVRHPNEQGFDHYEGALGNLFYTSSDRRATWNSYEKVVDGQITWAEAYATRDTTNDAIRYLGQMEPPWFLFVSYNAPHTPFHVPPRALYSGDRLDRRAPDLAKFNAVTEALDREIGRLLEAMTPDQRANTYVVFVGDNGTDRDAIRAPRDPEHGKLTLMEGGTNVPMIVSGPGVAQGETQALVHLVDLLPTMAASAGITPSGPPLDGVSFLDALDDPSDHGARGFVYTERFRPVGGGPYRLDLRAIRDDRYKVIRDTDGSMRFYDLQDRHDDGPSRRPGELKGKERERFKRLEAELARLESQLRYAH